MTKKVCLSLLIALLVLPLAACAQSAGAALIKSDKPRITSPAISPSDETEMVGGNSTFAFDLYHQLRNGDGNLFYSPYSISTSLAMTYAGARGETEKQINPY